VLSVMLVYTLTNSTNVLITVSRDHSPTQQVPLSAKNAPLTTVASYVRTTTTAHFAIQDINLTTVNVKFATSKTAWNAPTTSVRSATPNCSLIRKEHA
jgi:hypothetical protein